MPPVIRALSFTVTLTLVVPTVGVLPILLLATVMIVLPPCSALITSIPRLGVI